MSWKRGIRWVLLVLVVLSVVPSGATAQSAAVASVPLDQGVTEIATIDTGNETYVIYRYRNPLPYASGVAIVSERGRVTDPEVANEVFQALAQRRGTKFEPVDETIAELERVIQRSREIQNATDRATRTIERARSYRERLEDTEVNDSDAWDLITDESESLDDAYTGRKISPPPSRTLMEEQLPAARRAAAAVEADAQRVIELLRQREGETEANRSALYRRYRLLYEEIGQMEEQLSQTRELLVETSRLSRQGAQEAADVPEVGDAVRRNFTEIADELNASEAELGAGVEAIEALQDPLPPVVTDEAYQQRLTDEWYNRLDARVAVYATLGETGIVALAGLIVLLKS